MSDSNRRDRNALIALGLALLAIVLASWFSQPVSNNISNANTNTVQQQQEGEFSEVSEISQDIKIFGDTYPQWIMAFFSIAATAVSFLAVVWVKRTLLETRRIGQAQVRAYPHFTDVKAMGGKGDENPVVRANQTGIMFVVIVKNAGASPVLRTKLRTRIRWYPIKEFKVEEGGFWDTQEMYDISPQSGGTAIFAPIFPLGVIPRVRSDELEIEIGLRLDFFDVFEDERTIQAAYYLHGPDFDIPMTNTPHTQSVRQKRQYG